MQPLVIPEYQHKYAKGTTVFEDVFLGRLQALRSKYLQPTNRYIVMEEIIDTVKLMQDCKMDVHIAVMGQNGVGKTYTLLMFMKKYLGKKWLPNLLLARHTTNDFINFLLTNNNTLLGIDELNQYLDYKKHMDEEQQHLIRQIELSRDNRVAVVGCIRDARKLTINYRQGKLSVIIWVLDRFMDKGSYAAVFISNPTVESSDKFGLSFIAGDIISFNDLRYIIEEKMYSFVGYMKIPDVKTLLSNDEIAEYEEQKRIAKTYAHINYIFDQYKRRHIDMTEVMSEIKRASTILRDETGEIERELILKIPTQYSMPTRKKKPEVDVE